MVLCKMSFRSEDQEALQPLVQPERAHIAELKGRGIITALYIATDGSAAWVFFDLPDVATAETVVAEFPMRSLATVEFNEILAIP